MSLIQLIFVLVIIGVVLYLLERYIPMSPPIKLVLQVVIVLIAIYWLLQAIGLIGGTPLRLK